jgi:hypothetical protein
MVNRAIGHLGGGQPPYVLHRLDQWTSGLLLFAKRVEVVAGVHAQFRCVCGRRGAGGLVGSKRMRNWLGLRGLLQLVKAVLPRACLFVFASTSCCRCRRVPQRAAHHPEGTPGHHPRRASPTHSPPPPLLSRLRTTQKAYLAITQGVPQAAAFSVDAPIGAHGGIKEARAVGGADAKPATTGVCAGWVR